VGARKRKGDRVGQRSLRGLLRRSAGSAPAYSRRSRAPIAVRGHTSAVAGRLRRAQSFATRRPRRTPGPSVPRRERGRVREAAATSVRPGAGGPTPASAELRYAPSASNPRAIGSPSGARAGHDACAPLVRCRVCRTWACCGWQRRLSEAWALTRGRHEERAAKTPW
jgi:hypothetical protein